MNFGGEKNMMPLALLSAAERAEVTEVRNGNKCLPRRDGAAAPKTRSCQDRVEDMGVRVGKVVEVLSNEGQGPILLKVDESRIAMGRGIAMKIMVRRLEV